MSRQIDNRTGRTSGNPPLHYAAGRLDRRADPYGMPADFVSQLLATRERMAIQRFENLSPTHIASNAYVRGSRIAVKRMPNGYVRTLVV